MQLPSTNRAAQFFHIVGLPPTEGHPSKVGLSMSGILFFYHWEIEGAPGVTSAKRLCGCMRHPGLSSWIQVGNSFVLQEDLDIFQLGDLTVCGEDRARAGREVDRSIFPQRQNPEFDLGRRSGC